VLTRRVDPAGLNLTTTYAYDAKADDERHRREGIVTRRVQTLKGEVTRTIVDPAGLNIRTAYATTGVARSSPSPKARARRCRG